MEAESWRFDEVGLNSSRTVQPRDKLPDDEPGCWWILFHVLGSARILGSGRENSSIFDECYSMRPANGTGKKHDLPHAAPDSP